MGIFGWSLPPGCGTLPGEEPEPIQPRCHCGAFLSYEPDEVRTDTFMRTDYGEKPPKHAVNIKEIDSPLDFAPSQWYEWEVEDSQTTLIWKCRKCGDTVELGDY